MVKEETVDAYHLVDENKEALGLVAELGNLNPKSVIFESGLAKMFGRHATSVKRAVERGELPQPTRLFGQNAWTVEVITDHITTRLLKAEKERAEYDRKIKHLIP